MTAKKRTVAKKKVAARKKIAAKKAVAKRGTIRKPEPGFDRTKNGILVPSDREKPVPASKLRTGFRNAKKEIESMIEEVVGTMAQNYVICEIELAASFNADGKFMGFGVGGAATMKIKVRPE
jgi:hypothetical protein